MSTRPSSVLTPQSFLETCQRLNIEMPDMPSNCGAEWQRYVKAYPYETRTMGLIYALVPIPLGWVIIWSAFGVVRWIRTGFVK
jgi:hypothetical protein